MAVGGDEIAEWVGGGETAGDESETEVCSRAGREGGTEESIPSAKKRTWQSLEPRLEVPEVEKRAWQSQAMWTT